MALNVASCLGNASVILATRERNMKYVNLQDGRYLNRNPKRSVHERYGCEQNAEPQQQGFVKRCSCLRIAPDSGVARDEKQRNEEGLPPRIVRLAADMRQLQVCDELAKD